MTTDNLTHTIDLWIKALDQYNITQLQAKPSMHSWSLGQLYMHLIADTNYYINQIKICLSFPEHIEEEASSTAKTMFLNNDFPDEIIEGAPSNAFIPQPNNKEQLLDGLLKIKDELTRLAVLISSRPLTGKTKHPGFNYFNAGEWLQFSEMHFRHHLRQKKRIDDFLKTKYYVTAL